MSAQWAVSCEIDCKGVAVTGAASSIDCASAELLAAPGAAVFAVDRDVVHALADPILRLARDFDLLTTAGIPHLIAGARLPLGSLDVLAHRAARQLPQPLVHVTGVEWGTRPDINAKADLFLKLRGRRWYGRTGHSDHRLHVGDLADRITDGCGRLHHQQRRPHHSIRAFRASLRRTRCAGEVNMSGQIDTSVQRITKTEKAFAAAELRVLMAGSNRLVRQ